MPAVKIDDRSTLTTAMVYVEEERRGKDNWGWWCPVCSRPGVLIGLDGYANKPKALRSANKHEIRRGHQ